jgi:hypothetical protein
MCGLIDYVRMSLSRHTSFHIFEQEAGIDLSLRLRHIEYKAESLF